MKIFTVCLINGLAGALIGFCLVKANVYVDTWEFWGIMLGNGILIFCSSFTRPSYY